ncbi:hypothetical protein ACJ41O_003536 [Fusarium nematophilum]
MSVRPATQADLPALKDVVLSALTPDPIWAYLFTSRVPVTAEASTYVEDVLKRCLDPDNGSWQVSVVEAPKTHQVVSLAVVQTLHENEGSIDDQIQRIYNVPDVSNDKVARRIAALKAAISKSQQTYLSRHGHLMFVHAVITHPHWKRQGYAKLLVKQSLRQARQQGAVVTSLASPFSGYVFYSGTGFANCGRTGVDVEGEMDRLELQVMVCAPPPQPDASARRGSSFMDSLGFGQASPDRRPSHDQPEQRRGSFLDMFSFGGRRASSDVDARRSSHH